MVKECSSCARCAAAPPHAQALGVQFVRAPDFEPLRADPRPTFKREFAQRASRGQISWARLRARTVRARGGIFEKGYEKPSPIQEDSIPVVRAARPPPRDCERLVFLRLSPPHVSCPLESRRARPAPSATKAHTGSLSRRWPTIELAPSVRRSSHGVPVWRRSGGVGGSRALARHRERGTGQRPTADAYAGARGLCAGGKGGRGPLALVDTLGG